MKIESFVRRSKASLEFAINATRNKKLFEWMASVERSLATISTEIDSLLLNVSDTKALIEDLKKKVMKGADNAHWWAVACHSISVIGYVAAIASVLAISVVAAPYCWIPFAMSAGLNVFGMVMEKTSKNKKTTAKELKKLEDGLGKLERSMD